MTLLHKLSKSRPSSANTSPASTPLPLDSPTPNSPSPFPPNSPNSSMPPNKSFWSEKGKSLRLRLPSLHRSRSRSKREISAASDAASPTTLQSPVERSNSHNSLLDVDGTRGATTNSQPVCAQDGKHAAQRRSRGGTLDSLEEELKLVFKEFDANGDGKISAEELCCVLRALGDNAAQEEAELMVAEADMDKDGFIDLQEFIDLNTRVGGGAGGDGEQGSGGSNVTAELAAAFEMFDLDKNGCITPEELHCVLENLCGGTSTLEDCKRMIGGVDRKGRGHVDFDDFKIMMTSSYSSVVMA